MKLFFLLFAIFLFPVQAFSQAKCDIINNYGNFISIQKISYDDEEYVFNQVIETVNQDCYTNLINNNIDFINYLMTNFSSPPNETELLKITDSLKLQNKYISDLQKDSAFNSIMLELVSKSIDKSKPKDSISMDKLLNIAVKYFSIFQIDDNDNYVGKVCAGLNGIESTEILRKPFVEAFCFSSILNHYQSDEYSMHEEFVKAIQELYKVNLGIDKQEKLLRSQGAIFLLMRNNENLKNMLLSEYEKKKEYLPFILTEKK